MTVPLGVVLKDVKLALGVVRRRPFSCTVQVTNRCNMQCSFCDFWPHPAPPGEELTAAELAGLGRQLAEMGTFVISIEGGEPLVRKDLVEIVAGLSERHVTLLYTNGWYVTPGLARTLWDAGLAHASVSIDYPDSARHDAKRGLAGATERAWRAVETLRDAAPRAGKQVNVMTVLTRESTPDLEALLAQSARRSVGHQLTLLSTDGHRRGKTGDSLPAAGISGSLVRLWERYEHVRFFRSYLERIDAFLEGGTLPVCRAGVQSFNVDHVGNVAGCIEWIDRSVGNLRETSLRELHARLERQQADVARCQKCWTACRGFAQALGGGGTLADLADLARRTRGY